MSRPNSKDYLQWERSDGWGNSNGGKAGRPGGQGGCSRQAAGIARGPQTPRVTRAGGRLPGKLKCRPPAKGRLGTELQTLGSDTQ